MTFDLMVFYLWLSCGFFLGAGKENVVFAIIDFLLGIYQEQGLWAAWVDRIGFAAFFLDLLLGQVLNGGNTYDVPQ